MNRRLIPFAVGATAAAALFAWSVQAGAAPAVKPKLARVKVTLTVDDRTPTGGDPVSLSAKARKLPRGGRLLIQERDAGANIWSIVSECGAAACTGQWTEPDTAADTFRAIAVMRKRGARGPIVATLGKSALVAVAWKAPPPPPPPPPPPSVALAGHYCGFNDQGKSVCLDVAPDSSSVTDFVTESIVTCTDSSRFEWQLTFRTEQSITDLAFHYAFSGTLTSSSSDLSNIKATYSIDGTFDTAGNVSGTLALTSISWDESGRHFDCSSAPYGWKAKLNA